jgi:hypothetical protein
MNELRQFNFTEEDFKMMFEGLDAIPAKESATELLMSVMIGGMARSDEQMKKLQAEITNKNRLGSKFREVHMENIAVLKSKLIMFKRYLQAQDAIDSINANG